MSFLEKRFFVKIWLKNNRQMLLRGAGTVLAIVLLVVLLYQSGWQDVSAALKRISFWNLALAFGCIVLSRLCITARWYVLLRSGGVKIPFKDAQEKLQEMERGLGVKLLTTPSGEIEKGDVSLTSEGEDLLKKFKEFSAGIEAEIDDRFKKSF